jgi:hypothetical protein
MGTNPDQYGVGVIYSLCDIAVGGSFGGNNYTRNLYPYAGGQGNCGTDTHYWGAGYFNYLMPGGTTRAIGQQNNHWGIIWVDYVRYDENSQSFDALDDLALVKNYSTKIVKESDGNGGEIDVEVIDIKESLPHLLDGNGMRSPARDIGYLLGCAKFTAKEIDRLKQEIADLKAQLAS